MVVVTRKLLTDVGGDVACFRTDDSAEFGNAFSKRSSNEAILLEHTGVDVPKYDGVVERGVGLIQEGGMAA